MDLRHPYIRRTAAAAIALLAVAVAPAASARLGLERDARFEGAAERGDAARFERGAGLETDARFQRGDGFDADARFDERNRFVPDEGVGGDGFDDDTRFQRSDAFDADARFDARNRFEPDEGFDDDARPDGFVPMLAPSDDRFVPARTDLERETRREALRPPITGVDDDDWLSPRNRLLWLSREAMVRGVIGDLDGAAAAWERAIGIGQDSIGAWRKLARIRLRQERIEASEAALLWATDLAEQRPEFGAAERAAAWRDLGELYLELGYPRDAGEALDHSLEIFDDDHTRALLGHARRQVQAATGVRAPEATDPVPELFPPNEIEQRRARIEARFAALPEPLRGWLTFDDGRVDYLRAAQLAGGLLLMLCVLPFLRRKGEIAVRIAYPDSLEGRFWVAVTPEAGKIKRPAAGEPPPRRMRNALGFKPGVSREVHFGRIRTGRAVVTLCGELQDTTSGEVLTTPFEEQTIQVKSRVPAEVTFDVRPRDCPVDVHVRWDKRRGTEIGVVARGMPSSLRYASEGQLRLRLPMGAHTVIVGSEDRVAEVDVVVDSFRPQTLMVDLAGNEHVVFKGCPPAVQPYLLGDLQASARALEQDGNARASHLLLARLHQMNGSTERAAEQLESAGQTLEAARLRDSISDFERAAALYENAGSIVEAAESYRNAGLHDKAGELFESVAQLAEAEACYRASDNTAALVGVLERQREFMQAADLAEASGDRAQAIRLLQQVTTADPNYAASCKRLALAFKTEGHADLAAHKYEAYVSAVGRSAVTGDEAMDLAALQIESDHLERALETLEDLRNREPTHPGVAQSIESLRKRIATRKAESSGGAGPVTSVPTQFVSDHRYEILGEIGRGGMGLIFKARDRRLNRIVALKRLPENLREHPKAVKLFLNEAQAAARLNHPNIVTVHDTDQEDGTFFITMELLEGYPLNVVLRKRGKLSTRDTVKIGMQVAVGLQYAHAQQIVHRDIKTSNLFITREKTVKTMDFGLAKMMEEVRRGSTVVGGTPYYMAPEQAAGETIDHRADIYAFGVTLFEFITGRVPFQEGDVQYHHRHTPPPDPRSIEPGCPDALAELVLEMMAKSPDDRVADAATVGARLEAILAEA
jgi:tetratricopeptide (TPR) repeat protein